MRRTRKRPTRDAQTTWSIVAAALDYPTPDLLGAIDHLQSTARGLPAARGVPLQRLLDRIEATPLRSLQANYVETFDLSRRRALYLTYFAYGDTRRRGAALVRFKEVYRRHGLEWDDEASGGELPDHLCAVLSFGALVGVGPAWDLLRDYRAGIEMLRLALADCDGSESPWHDGLLALCSTFPDMSGNDAEAIRRLISEGPPREEVGLDPYAATVIAGPTIPVRPSEGAPA